MINSITWQCLCGHRNAMDLAELRKTSEETNFRHLCESCKIVIFCLVCSPDDVVEFSFVFLLEAVGATTGNGS